MIYRGFIFVSFSVLTLSLNLAAQGKQDPPKLELSAAEKAILDLTNKARADEKLPPLKPNLKLFQAARQHATNMAKQEKMEHELDGKKVTHRVKEVGYVYKLVGENIAESENVTLKVVVNGWLDSKAHRDNMLGKEFTEIGLGVAQDSKAKMYYTQVFGAPR